MYNAKMNISIKNIEPTIHSWDDIGVVSDDIDIWINFTDPSGNEVSIPTDTSILDIFRFITKIISEKKYETIIGTPSADFLGCEFIGNLEAFDEASIGKNETGLRLLILRPESRYQQVPVSVYYWLYIPFIDFVSAVGQFVEDLKIEMEKRKDPKLFEKDKIGYERFMKEWNETLQTVDNWKKENGL